MSGEAAIASDRASLRSPPGVLPGPDDGQELAWAARRPAVRRVRRRLMIVSRLEGSPAGEQGRRAVCLGPRILLELDSPARAVPAVAPENVRLQEEGHAPA